MIYLPGLFRLFGFVLTSNQSALRNSKLERQQTALNGRHSFCASMKHFSNSPARSVDLSLLEVPRPIQDSSSSAQMSLFSELSLAVGAMSSVTRRSLGVLSRTMSSFSY